MSDNTTTDKTFTIKDIEAERAHAQHFKQELEEIKAKFKGIDPDKFSSMQAELDALKNEKVSKTGDPKELESRIAEKEREIAERYQSKLSETEQALESAKSALKHEQATKPTLTRIATLVTGEDQAQLLEPVIRGEADIVDGKVIFKGQDGKPRYSKTKPNELMGIDEYVGELKNRFPGSFKAEGVSGGKNGAQPIRTTNGIEINSLADAAKLPDKGKAFFAELAAKDPAKLKQIMNTGN